MDGFRLWKNSFMRRSRNEVGRWRMLRQNQRRKPAGLKANHGVTGISIVLGNSTSISIVALLFTVAYEW